MRAIHLSPLALGLLFLLSCTNERESESFLFKNRYRIWGELPNLAKSALIIDSETLEPAGKFVISYNLFPPTDWSLDFRGTYFENDGKIQIYSCRRQKRQTAHGKLSDTVTCMRSNPEVY